MNTISLQVTPMIDTGAYIGSEKGTGTGACVNSLQRLLLWKRVTGDLLRWKEGRMLWDPVRVPQLQPGSTLTTIIFIAIFMFSTNKSSHTEASHNRSYSPLN